MTPHRACVAVDERCTLVTVIAERRALSRKIDPLIQLFGRIKTGASTARKMSNKGLRQDQVLDIIGVRAITRSEVDYYRLADRIGDAFVTLKTEFDDYIEQPKANGYRSTHMTLVHPSGYPEEVQVRTRWMDEIWSRGAAGHARYKEASLG